MIGTKVVEFDGVQFTIARLKVGQVQEFSEGQTQGVVPTAAQTNARGALVISHSFNNAAKLKNESQDWTPERVLDEIDFPTFNFLNGEIMGFMGWRPAVVEGEKKSAAADAPLSPTSTGTKL